MSRTSSEKMSIRVRTGALAVASVMMLTGLVALPGAAAFAEDDPAPPIATVQSEAPSEAQADQNAVQAVRTASGTLSFPSSVDTATRNKVSIGFVMVDPVTEASTMRVFKVGDPGFSFNASSGAWSVSGLDARKYAGVSARIGAGEYPYQVAYWSEIDLTNADKAGLNATVTREGSIRIFVGTKPGEFNRAKLYIKNTTTGEVIPAQSGNAGSSAPGYVEGAWAFPVAPGKYTLYAKLDNGLTVYYDGPQTASGGSTRTGSVQASDATVIDLEAFSSMYPESLDLRDWLAKPAPAFTDVPKTHKYYTHIMWMAENGITSGVKQSDGTLKFLPQTAVTRGAMITFLFRLDPSSANYQAPSKSPFTDVQPGHKYYKQVMWAYENKITMGAKQKDGTRKFLPGDPISRSAMSVFMYRLYSDTVSGGTHRSTFGDVPKTHKYYTQITWMAANGITNGVKQKDGTYAFRPAAQTSRAATAVFLYRAETS